MSVAAILRRAWLVLASGVLPEFALVLLVVALLERGAGDRSAGAGVVVGLERLQDLVAALLVNRNLVADPHPLGSLVGLHVEHALVERGGVVDDHDDLGLRVEVGARANDQVVHLHHGLFDVRFGCHVASSAASDRMYIRSKGITWSAHSLAEILELAKLTLDLGLDVQRFLSLSLAPLVARHDELSHLLAQPGVPGE